MVWWQFAPKFNVSAAQYVPAVRLHDGLSEAVMLRWGLIPSWVEAHPDGAGCSSVSSDALECSKMSSMAWLAGRRCILPAAGFYAWRLTREKYRQPFFVRLINRSVFGVAAVWDRWTSDDDDVIESCAVVSVAANELMADINAERGMPAILRRKDYQTWLQGTPTQARATLRPYDARWMQSHPVSPRINCAAVNDPALILAAY